MIVATLTFTLPDDAYEHRCALDGSRWHSFVCRLDESMRQIEKYGNDEKDADRAAWARALLRNALHEEGLEL